MKVRKAVITAAGRGTRFLPVTKAQPKEMLPLVDKPLIQYSVEEAINSGIEQIIIITAMGKQAVENYFDRSPDLEFFLEQKGDKETLKQIREISEMINVCYVRQKEQLGLGHAILTAKDIVGNEPFAVILPDDIVDSPVPTLKSMIDIYTKHNASVIAVQKIEREDSSKYGVIQPKKTANHVYQVMSLVEKPQPEEAPSNLGIVGRYVLTPEIFETLENTPPGTGREIQITDALQLLLQKQAIYAYELEGTRYDTGTPIGWLKATIAYALKRPDIAPELKKYLRNLG